jgi:hypothetical protein
MPEYVIMDANGNPVLLANVPGSGVAKRDADTASGNPNHDTRSGKFGSGGNKKRGPQPRANQDPLDFKRLIDAVRRAAREYEVFGEAEIQKFLKGNAKNPDVVDINSFLAAVTEQKKNDIVDILDAKLRNSKGPQLKAPRGFAEASLKGLSPDDVAEVMDRLEGSGHDAKRVEKFLGRRMDPEAKEEVKTRRESAKEK